MLGPETPTQPLVDANRHAGGEAAVVAVVRDGRLIADPAAAGEGRDGDLVIVVGTMTEALTIMDALQGAPG